MESNPIKIISAMAPDSITSRMKDVGSSTVDLMFLKPSAFVPALRRGLIMPRYVYRSCQGLSPDVVKQGSLKILTPHTTHAPIPSHFRSAQRRLYSPENLKPAGLIGSDDVP